MVESLISFVIYLIIVGVILWLLDYIIGVMPMFQPFRQMARTVLMVIGGLILILLLLRFAGLWTGSVRL